jgi:hypothetical protein
MGTKMSEIIKEHAQELRDIISKLKFSSMFGEPFDVNDPDCVLLAAFALGAKKKKKELRRTIENDFLFCHSLQKPTPLVTDL